MMPYTKGAIGRVTYGYLGFYLCSIQRGDLVRIISVMPCSMGSRCGPISEGFGNLDECKNIRYAAEYYNTGKQISGGICPCRLVPHDDPKAKKLGIGDLIENKEG